MKNWLRYKLKSFLDISTDSYGNAAMSRLSPVPSAVSNEFDADGLVLKIYSATGGHVLEFRKYDRDGSRTKNTLYIISNTENFSEAVTKCINLEILR
jgi:hypothetical protein